MEAAQLQLVRRAYCLAPLTFGATIGLLASFSTAKGLTVTLVGLLFTMIGGSVLSWFDKTKLAPRNRFLFLTVMGFTSGGVIVGILAGFVLIGLDKVYLQPYVLDQRIKSLQKTGKSVNLDLLKQLSASKLSERFTEESLERLLRLHAKDKTGGTLLSLAKVVEDEAERAADSSPKKAKLVKLADALTTLSTLQTNPSIYLNHLSEKNRKLLEDSLKK